MSIIFDLFVVQNASHSIFFYFTVQHSYCIVLLYSLLAILKFSFSVECYSFHFGTFLRFPTFKDFCSLQNASHFIFILILRMYIIFSFFSFVFYLDVTILFECRMLVILIFPVFHIWLFLAICKKNRMLIICFLFYFQISIHFNVKLFHRMLLI